MAEPFQTPEVNAESAIELHSPNGNDEADTNKLSRSLQATVSAFSELETQRRAEEVATKGRFNLFTVLRSGNDERGLHYRYLAHLLSPREVEDCHDCGSLFLDLFLDTLRDGVRPHEDSAADEQLNDLKGLRGSNAKVMREF